MSTPHEAQTATLADRNNVNDRLAVAAAVTIVESDNTGNATPAAGTTDGASEGHVAVAVVDSSPAGNDTTSNAPTASLAPQPVHAIAIPQFLGGRVGDGSFANGSAQSADQVRRYLSKNYICAWERVWL